MAVPSVAPHRADDGAGSKIRTYVATRASDLQSDVFDRSTIPAFIQF